MRILHVVPTYLPATRYGGPIYSVHGLVKALVETGQEVHVFTTNVDGDRVSNVPLNTPVEMDGARIWYFPCPFLRRIYYAPQMIKTLKAITGQIDIIHLHSVFLWPTSAVAGYAQSNSIPYLLSPRGMLDKDLIRRKSRWIKTAWLTLFNSKDIEHASGLHLTSVNEIQAIQEFGYQLPKLYMVPNGVDWPALINRDSFALQNEWVQSRRPYVLFLGRINWKKGLDRLIRAWKHVEKIDLLIAGNDEENYIKTLEDIINKENLKDRIHFIGYVSGDLKWLLYQQAELFVLPSYSENFGNVVLEAMSVGCPVVVTPEVGASSIIEKNQCGLVTIGEPQTLSATINRLLVDKALRADMGRRGMQATQLQYSWHEVAKNMMHVYKDMLVLADKLSGK